MLLDGVDLPEVEHIGNGHLVDEEARVGLLQLLVDCGKDEVELLGYILDIHRCRLGEAHSGLAAWGLIWQQVLLILHFALHNSNQALRFRPQLVLEVGKFLIDRLLAVFGKEFVLDLGARAAQVVHELAGPGDDLVAAFRDHGDLLDW